ncbi:hypothetical protein FRC08_009490 [Ceratobasidium sp. 394]|nr:hypothetical protein FRC08_009490 [Ceratobasidium sp. 394]
MAQQVTIVNGMYCNLSVPSEAPSPETYVLLAACKNEERAQEALQADPEANQSLYFSSGLFTTALIKTLRKCDLVMTSYAALTRAIQNQMISQISQISRGPPINQFALCKGIIPLEPGQREGTFSIKASSASGIQVGTELGVYLGGMSSKSLPLVRLVAIQVTAIDAVLCVQGTGSILELPQDAGVVVVKHTGHAVCILKSDQIKLPHHWEYVFRKLESSPIDIVWSNSSEPSDLVLVPTERGVLLQRQDPCVIQLEPRDILLGHELQTEDLV